MRRSRRSMSIEAKWRRAKEREPGFRDDDRDDWMYTLGVRVVTAGWLCFMPLGGANLFSIIYFIFLPLGLLFAVAYTRPSNNPMVKAASADFWAPLLCGIAGACQAPWPWWAVVIRGILVVVLMRGMTHLGMMLFPPEE